MNQFPLINASVSLPPQNTKEEPKKKVDPYSFFKLNPKRQLNYFQKERHDERV